MPDNIQRNGRKEAPALKTSRAEISSKRYN